MNSIKDRANLRRKSSVNILPLSIPSVKIGRFIKLRKHVVFKLELILYNILIISSLLLDILQLIQTPRKLVRPDISTLDPFVEALCEKSVSLK